MRRKHHLSGLRHRQRRDKSQTLILRKKMAENRGILVELTQDQIDELVAGGNGGTVEVKQRVTTSSMVTAANLGNTGQIIGSTGDIFVTGWFISRTPTVFFAKFYYKNTAGAAGDTPFMIVPINGGTVGNPTTTSIDINLLCTNNLSIRVTKDPSDADTTAPSAGALLNFYYTKEVQP